MEVYMQRDIYMHVWWQIEQQLEVLNVKFGSTVTLTWHFLCLSSFVDTCNLCMAFLFWFRHGKHFWQGHTQRLTLYIRMHMCRLNTWLRDKLAQRNNWSWRRASFEQSFSKLKLVKTALKSAMSQDCISSLVIGTETDLSDGWKTAKAPCHNILLWHVTWYPTLKSKKNCLVSLFYVSWHLGDR